MDQELKEKLLSAANVAYSAMEVLADSRAVKALQDEMSRPDCDEMLASLLALAAALREA
jgi:hypothetical protein